jgi:hypothetical protein
MLVAAMVLMASTAEAQNRSALVDQARAELPGSATALDLLQSAANPLNAPRDSLWAVAVYDIADNLINVGEGDLASVWLRWVARHGGQPIDRVWYPQGVEAQYDVAVTAVDTDGGLGDVATETTWTWPASFDVGAPGTLRVTSANPDLDVTVTVQGGGTVGPGGSLDLPPGTYRITASAPGYDAVDLSREVLPGVATVLSYDLPAQLAMDVQADVVASLARISFTQNGQLVCSNGVIADPQGLVLTTLSSVQSAVQIDVFTQQGGSFTDYEILRRDVGRDLAVLAPRDPTGPARQLGPVPVPASEVAGAQYAWSVHQPGCADPMQARTRVSDWPAQPVGLVSLPQELPTTAAGSPLVDRSGAWLGMVTGPTTVLPWQLADELIDSARDDLVAAGAQISTGEGGIPSWVWIAGGVGVAGAAVALLMPGGTSNGGAETGGIRISFPNPGS